jgi:hypothetical protein
MLGKTLAGKVLNDLKKEIEKRVELAREELEEYEEKLREVEKAIVELRALKSDRDG